eukprot:TRINITY_DN3309_c0_g1_i1.p1 TRINITY_DN3309_c0_g1~~TRINITY_DN3309_c0_g1_i1.p1  ORF type:complete len:113 (+),score=15.74 TRINITY_DN3309_c0_g1_i1:451-789(+)
MMHTFKKLVHFDDCCHIFFLLIRISILHLILDGWYSIDDIDTTFNDVDTHLLVKFYDRLLIDSAEFSIYHYQWSVSFVEANAGGTWNMGDVFTGVAIVLHVVTICNEVDRSC